MSKKLILKLPEKLQQSSKFTKIILQLCLTQGSLQRANVSDKTMANNKLGKPETTFITTIESYGPL